MRSRRWSALPTLVMAFIAAAHLFAAQTGNLPGPPWNGAAQCDRTGTDQAVTYFDDCSCQACAYTGGGCTYCYTNNGICYTDGFDCAPVNDLDPDWDPESWGPPRRG